MKTIGLLGGMSWESTALYYRWINEEAQRNLGALHSAPIVMSSVDFHEVEALQRQGDWHQAGALLAEQARRIQMAGAELLLICTNTMHKVADQVEAAIDIPLLHIADATAQRIRESGMQTVGLLGTKFTMEQDFYRGRLEQHGLRVLTPGRDDRNLVHTIIYEELCQGRIVDTSRSRVLRIVDELYSAGAQGIIEGCTEIVLLVQEQHTDVPLFDTTAIHATAAVAQALAL